MMSKVLGQLFNKCYPVTSIQGTPKEKHLLHSDSHWQGFTAAHEVRRHKHHKSGNGVPRITWRTACMSIMVSMGGMIFGYDTGLCIMRTKFKLCTLTSTWHNQVQYLAYSTCTIFRVCLGMPKIHRLAWDMSEQDLSLAW